jgi:hypothetical protein
LKSPNIIRYIPGLCNFKNANLHIYTVKPVDKGHSREPENVAFMSYCPLYTG